MAEALGPRAIGVILSGMGSDGAEGLLRLHEAGADTIAQDESTSAVFGMPKAALEAGGVKTVLKLDRIAPTLAALASPPTQAHSKNPASSETSSEPQANAAHDRDGFLNGRTRHAA